MTRANRVVGKRRQNAAQAFELRGVSKPAQKLLADRAEQQGLVALQQTLEFNDVRTARNGPT